MANTSTRLRQQLSSTNTTVAQLFGLGLQEGKLPFGTIGTPELSLFGITPGPGQNGARYFQSGAELQEQLFGAGELEYRARDSA